MTELYTHISNRALKEPAERYEHNKAAAITAAKKRIEEGGLKSTGNPVNRGVSRSPFRTFFRTSALLMCLGFR